jgi:hypothetical protein
VPSSHSLNASPQSSIDSLRVGEVNRLNTHTSGGKRVLEFSSSSGAGSANATGHISPIVDNQSQLNIFPMSDRGTNTVHASSSGGSHINCDIGDSYIKDNAQLNVSDSFQQLSASASRPMHWMKDAFPSFSSSAHSQSSPSPSSLSSQSSSAIAQNSRKSSAFINNHDLYSLCRQLLLAANECERAEQLENKSSNRLTSPSKLTNAEYSKESAANALLNLVHADTTHVNLSSTIQARNPTLGASSTVISKKRPRQSDDAKESDHNIRANDSNTSSPVKQTIPPLAVNSSSNVCDTVPIDKIPLNCALAIQNAALTSVRDRQNQQVKACQEELQNHATNSDLTKHVNDTCEAEAAILASFADFASRITSRVTQNLACP